MSKSSNSSEGIGILGVLQIIFIVLKLIGTIQWAWWTVFMPTFIGIGLGAIGLIIGIICYIKLS